MAIGYCDPSKITAIADSIRAKKGTTDKIMLENMPTEISSIETKSPEQEKSIDITSNGTVEVTPDDGYLLSKVTVNTDVAQAAAVVATFESGVSFEGSFVGDKPTVAQGMFDIFWPTSLDLSNFDTSSITDMSNMFEDHTGLISLNVSNWDTSKVTDMHRMFVECNALTELDLSSFNTSKVTDMSYMFEICNSLTSLNVSSFITNEVTDMNSMFRYCSSLTSLDLSRFDTSKVTDMIDMFDNCSSLTTLNLSSFNTAEVTRMGQMFRDCSSLVVLDLSNFNTSKVTSIDEMFDGCSSLTTLDLSNWDTSELTTMEWRTFRNCTSLTSLTLGENWASNSSVTYFDLSSCPLTHDSCLDVFNKLAERTNSPTIKISSSTKALMSDEEIKIATDKGWKVS